MSTLFVSDLHLDGAWPGAIRQFERFLAGPAHSSQALYILGDLFEAWVGDDDPDPARAAVLASLHTLTQSGVPCYVMHGNRDFLLQSGFEARSGCQLLADPTIIELRGRRTLLTHGDVLCTADFAYQRLRSVVRRPAWQRRFMALPLATRQGLAQLARAGSRAHTGRMHVQIMDVAESSVQALMRECGVHTLIHGHTHRPGVHRFMLDGSNAERLVLGAWYEQGSCLRFDQDGFELQTLARDGPE
ncbi:MAG TPA: UDP-2,3-diacylglucosamine diphosphatase [Steroidobacteraceae bacterium]